MLDVHPPHHAANTWRDFFLHIATIVVGLLIAIGLEQTVESFHYRHQRHTAEHNLAMELEANRRTLAEDEAALRSSAQHLRSARATLESLRHHEATQGSLAASWQWNDLATGAWDTARNTNAAALMSYDEAQRYTDLYTQEKMVNDEAAVYIRGVYLIGAPLQLGRAEKDLTPAEIDAMQASIEHSSSDVAYLLDLCRSLDIMYAHSAVAKPE